MASREWIQVEREAYANSSRGQKSAGYRLRYSSTNWALPDLPRRTGHALVFGHLLPDDGLGSRCPSSTWCHSRATRRQVQSMARIDCENWLSSGTCWIG